MVKNSHNLCTLKYVEKTTVSQRSHAGNCEHASDTHYEMRRHVAYFGPNGQLAIVAESKADGNVLGRQSVTAKTAAYLRMHYDTQCKETSGL